MKIKKISQFRKKGIVSHVKEKGFTLVELILTVSFITAASVIIYMIYDKAKDMKNVENEFRNISEFVASVENMVETSGSYTGITTANLGTYGLAFNTGLNPDIDSPNPKTINITYKELSDKVCTGLTSQIEGKLGSGSKVVVKANGTTLLSPINPTEAARNCSTANNQNQVVISLTKLNTGSSSTITNVTQVVRPPKVEPSYPTFGINVPTPTLSIPDNPQFLAVTQPKQGSYNNPTAPAVPPIPGIIPPISNPNSGYTRPSVPATPGWPGNGQQQGEKDKYAGRTDIPRGFIEVDQICMQTRYVIHQTTQTAYVEYVVVEGPSPALCVPLQSSVDGMFLLEWSDAYTTQNSGLGLVQPVFQIGSGSTARLDNAYQYLQPFISQLMAMGSQLPPGQRFISAIPECSKFNIMIDAVSGPRIYFPESGSTWLYGYAGASRPTVMAESQFGTYDIEGNTLFLYVDKKDNTQCI